MKKIILTTLTLLLITSGMLNAQVTIGSDAAPDANSLLDLKNLADGTSDKGMLLPRVKLTSTTATTPLTAHIVGMVVYNTATVGDVTPGYYYNDGIKWVKLIADATLATTGWSLKGNAGTDTAINFIGTTDNKPLVIRTKNTPKVIVNDLGNMGIGELNPMAPLSISADNDNIITLKSTKDSISSNKLATYIYFKDTNNFPYGYLGDGSYNNKAIDIVGYNDYSPRMIATPVTYEPDGTPQIGLPPGTFYSIIEASLNPHNRIILAPLGEDSTTTTRIDDHGRLGICMGGYSKPLTERLEVNGSVKLALINSTAYTSTSATDKMVVADANGVLRTKDGVFGNIRTLSSGVIASNDYTILATGNISLPPATPANKGQIYVITNDTPSSTINISGSFRNRGSDINSDQQITSGLSITLQSTGSVWAVIKR